MQNSREYQGVIGKPYSISNAKKQRKTMNGKDKRLPQENWRHQGTISCKNGYNKGQKQ